MTTAINRTRGKLLAGSVERAATFMARLRGLMFRRDLPEGTGLHIMPCNSLHSCFMRFSFDAVFLDKNRRVVALIENMQPWQFSTMYRSACEVLELPAGTLAHSGTAVGDLIEFAVH